MYSVCRLCQKPWWHWYLNPVVDFGEVRKAQLTNIHSPHLHVAAPGRTFRSFMVCSDAKERVGAESNGKFPHLFTPSKTSTLVPEFAVKGLPLGRTATLVPEFVVKDLSLGRTLDDIYTHVCQMSRKVKYLILIVM